MVFLYDELLSLWEFKFGVSPLGVVGKCYLFCNYINSDFYVFQCRRDNRVLLGYRFVCIFSGSFDDIVFKYNL